MDLLDAAEFLTADGAERGEVVEFSTTITLDPDRVASARVVATAHGVYDLLLDGVPVSADVLAPGWTSYEWRLAYQEHDVTELLRGGPGGRRITARVGNGWFRGDLGFEKAMANYGEEIGLLLALEVVHTDGSRFVVATGPAGWTARTGAVVQNSLYDGQRTDATRLPRDLALRVGEFDRSRLVPQVSPPVRRQESLRPEQIWTSPSGAVLADFGQNLVGWVRLAVQGPRGTEITLRHAEVLEHEELGTRPLRAAKATDTFALAGEGLETFEPTFTFHGFRYVEVTGWPGTPTADDLEAVVVHSELRATSSFESSDPLLDRLVRNAEWGQKGNFLSVPTDCPQRDERLGWTGDLAVFAATACRQFDVADFLHGWLLDLAEELRGSEEGFVPVIVPDLLKRVELPMEPSFASLGAQAIWSDAAVWVPAALWTAYGDRDRLAEHYPAMVGHLGSVLPKLSDQGLWNSGIQLADWLDPDAPPDEPLRAKADPGVVATASFQRSVRLTAEAAEVLGFTDDADRWRSTAAWIREGFQAAYVDRGRVTSDCVTVYALALAFDLLDTDDVAPAAARLAELVTANGFRVSTGFAGTPYVTWALSENGYVDIAYRHLLETSRPSWLYPVTMGATTIWERWDSMLPDGTINPGDMTSFNHYALGAVVDWVHQVVGGIRPAAPGYREVLIEPRPGPGLTWARAHLDAPVGRISSSWNVDTSASDGGETFVLEVSTPSGVPTTVRLPDGTHVEFEGGSRRFAVELSPAASR